MAMVTDVRDEVIRRVKQLNVLCHKMIDDQEQYIIDYERQEYGLDEFGNVLLKALDKLVKSPLSIGKLKRFSTSFEELVDAFEDDCISMFSCNSYEVDSSVRSDLKTSWHELREHKDSIIPFIEWIRIRQDWLEKMEMGLGFMFDMFGTADKAMKRSLSIKTQRSRSLKKRKQKE